MRHWSPGGGSARGAPAAWLLTLAAATPLLRHSVTLSAQVKKEQNTSLTCEAQAKRRLCRINASDFDRKPYGVEDAYAVSRADLPYLISV
ncbi:hypothetical protein EJB05_05503, partial [Eragrostis curvula]